MDAGYGLFGGTAAWRGLYPVLLRRQGGPNFRRRADSGNSRPQRRPDRRRNGRRARRQPVAPPARKPVRRGLRPRRPGRGRPLRARLPEYGTGLGPFGRGAVDPDHTGRARRHHSGLAGLFRGACPGGPRPDPPHLRCGRPTVCPGRPYREQARSALGLPGRTGPAGPVPRRGERVRYACPKRRHPAFPRGRRHGLGHVRSHPAPAPDRERLRHVDQPPSAQRRTGPPNPRQRAPAGAEQDPLLPALGPVGRDDGHGHRAVARVEARPRPPYVDRGAGRPRDRCRRGPT